MNGLIVRARSARLATQEILASCGLKFGIGDLAPYWSLPRLSVERAALDHLCHSGRRVVGWLTFWFDNLSLDKLGVGVDDSLLDGWLRGFSSQLFGSLLGHSQSALAAYLLIGGSAQRIGCDLQSHR